MRLCQPAITTTMIILMMTVGIGSSLAQTAIVTSGQCYARSYTSAHLKAHPRQKVRAIALRKLEGTQAGVIAAGKSALAIGFNLRGYSQAFQAYAECSPQGASLGCFMEGDAGAFTLSRTAKDGLVMRVTRQLGVEGRTMIEFGGTSSDDNVFVLSKAGASSCASLKAP